MVTLTEAILLGVIQGLTEWLPVSSSGHLAVTQQLLHLEVPVIFDLCLHVGTLISVTYLLRTEVTQLVKALAQGDFKSREGVFVVNILLGGLSTALIALLLHNVITAAFTSLLVIGAGFAGTGLFLFLSKTRRGTADLAPHHALLIGLAQGVAALPGVSRSGVTISTGLILGVDRDTAVKYSFLLSIPTILVATMLDLRDIQTYQVDIVSLLVGVVVSAIVGYVSLKALTKIVHKRNGVSLFAPYCWALSALLIGTVMAS
jgi:undecaprenyl-diphosphatase